MGIFAKPDKAPRPLGEHLETLTVLRFGSICLWQCCLFLVFEVLLSNAKREGGTEQWVSPLSTRTCC